MNVIHTDGRVVESDTFPTDIIAAGWRVTLVMSGQHFPVTVNRCDPKCIEVDGGQRWIASGIEAILLYW